MAPRKQTRVYKSAAGAKRPQGDGDARALLARLGEIDREIGSQTETARQAIENIKIALKHGAGTLTEEAKAIHAVLKAYFEAHESRLTEEGKRKSVDWPEGRMGLRLSKPKIRLLDEEAVVIDALEARGLEHFLRRDVRAARDVMLAALLDGNEDLAGLASIEQRLEFFAAASALAIETSIETEDREAA